VLFGADRSDIERLVQEIKKCDPDVLILPGDIVPGTWNVRTPGENTYDTYDELRDSLDRQWDFVFEIFAPLDVPVWISPGNHDITSYTPDYRALVREVYTRRGGQPFHEKRLGAYRFLFLNTTLMTKDDSKVAGLDHEQLEWLRNGLDVPSSTVNFLFLHHALWYAGLERNPSNATGKKMVPLDWMQTVHPSLRGKVEFVFAGDGGQFGNHLFFEVRDDIHYYVNGCGKYGSSFLHVIADGKRIEVDPHFVQIRLTVQRGSSSIWAKVSRVAGDIYFWLGVCLGAVVVAGMAAIIAVMRASKVSTDRS
jgi:3',5'-cyclic AMP phosphodiesterase CpdA